MTAGELLQFVREQIEAIDVPDAAGPDDRFRGSITEQPLASLDRCFALSAGLPVRAANTSRQEWQIQVDVGVLYRDYVGAYERALTDAELVATVLYDLVDADPDNIVLTEVSEGQINPGPVEGTLSAERSVRVNYLRG